MSVVLYPIEDAMQVSEIRRKLIAPMFNLSDEYLRKQQDELLRQPSLRQYLPGRRAAGSDREGLLATASATALLVLTAMTGKSRDAVGAEVVRLWEAPLVDAGRVRWASRLELCGAGLMLLLSDARVRARLEALLLNQDIPEVVFAWDDGRHTTFAPFEPREWRRRKAENEAKPQHIVRLPGMSVGKIADLIAGDAA
jgi:hypothetical protein